jgi:hypothetical protein
MSWTRRNEVALIDGRLPSVGVNSLEMHPGRIERPHAAKASLAMPP